MAGRAESLVTLTHHKWVDACLLALILVLMLILSPRLRVYFDATLVTVTLDRIAPDGARITLATPDQFNRVGGGYWDGSMLMARLTPLIDSYMRESEVGRDASPGTRFEWTIHWSQNSLRLDQKERIVWEAPDGDGR